MENSLFETFVEMFKKGGGIHINPKNKGKFTASAKRAGMSVQEFARHVLANKDKYSNTLVKRANFARNAKTFKHQGGGSVGYPTHNNPRLEDPDIFNEEFIQYRDKQLESETNPYISNGKKDYNQAKKLGIPVADYMRQKKQLPLLAEYRPTQKQPMTYSTDQNNMPVPKFPKPTVNDFKRMHTPEDLINDAGKPGVMGVSNRDTNTYIVNPGAPPSTKVHEKTHLQHGGNQYRAGAHGMSYENGTAITSDETLAPEWRRYYFSGEELRARAKQMFFDNKLDPKHKYTEADVKAMKADPNFKWSFSRDEYISNYDLANLLNSVY